MVLKSKMTHMGHFLLGATLTSVECRSSTCKLQVQLEAGTEQADLEDDLVFSLGSKGFKSIKGYPSGENARTFYAGTPNAVPQSMQPLGSSNATSSTGK